ncbi:MAG TPA: hypothetical protein VIW45_03935 [Vicinamibacterales bacterium]|jgi:hypothetical protein
MRMLRASTLLATIACASACGDLLSLHALYTSTDRVTDPTIEGTWTNDDDRVTVQRDGDGYRVVQKNIKDPTDTAAFYVRLVDLAGVRFADLVQEDTLGHMIVRLRVADGKLRIAFLDSKWLRDRVPHEDALIRPTQPRAVVTLRTAQLRQLVTRYANEPKAFDEELVFHR